ncbi:MAG TPA: EthD domain-containing protein [Pseudomonadales bacterium]|jgi:hypothetical protein
MEKLAYILWRPEGVAETMFRQRLTGAVTQRLMDAGALGVQINVVDDAVRPADKTRQVNSTPAADAMAFIWVRSAIESPRLERILLEASRGLAGYLVTESEPIANTKHISEPGQRTPGYSQVVFLQKPHRMTYEGWLDYWLKQHTKVAIETQSNFRYVQNVIVRALTCAAPAWDAIVEECFPAEAMTNPMAFFNAKDDEEKFRKNQQAMIESCMKFIDFDRMNVIPTSEYALKKRNI